MDDFKKLTEQLLKIYINSESVNDLKIENYFDENISLIGTGKHEIYTNLHEFLKSFEFDVKRRDKIRIDIQNLHQEEERLDDVELTYKIYIRKKNGLMMIMFLHTEQ